ncbi:MBL fold metallo-hydrolase [Candidatus Woesearchaeota archaeon]|nr:MBL fold metallo-hydrolase [Candidatus Woesearchaeota archaeon]
MGEVFGKIGEKIWKFTGPSDKSNVYLIDGAKKIMIDTGNRTDRAHLINFMGKAVDFDKVDAVIFTHLHLDHCGNFDLFPKAQFYASPAEIQAFREDPQGTVLDSVVADKLSKIQIMPLPAELFGLKVIDTPGHTCGSVCLFYPAEKALFTGDTLFGTKRQGRVDLPTSAPHEMKNSQMKIIEIPHKLLCPGHDY